MNWSWIGGHDPIFQKLCSFPLPLFGTNCGGDGPKTMSTTKIQNKSEKVCWPHLRPYLCRTPNKLLLKKLWKPPQNISFEAVFVFCCRKRYSSESLAAQWIHGFTQLVFLFFCAFSSHFRTPILTNPCANRCEKRAVRQHSPLSYFSLMICSYSMAYFFSITMLLW